MVPNENQTNFRPIFTNVNRWSHSPVVLRAILNHFLYIHNTTYVSLTNLTEFQVTVSKTCRIYISITVYILFSFPNLHCSSLALYMAKIQYQIFSVKMSTFTIIIIKLSLSCMIYLSCYILL